LLEEASRKHMPRALPSCLVCLLGVIWPILDVDARTETSAVVCKVYSATGPLNCEPDPDFEPNPDPNPDGDPGTGVGTGPPVDRGCDLIAGRPINVNTRWDQVWQALNDRGGCTGGCHLAVAPAADLDLSSRQLAIYYLVGQQSTQGNVMRVLPGNAAASLLYQKIGCSAPAVGQPMPPPGGHLPEDIQGLIYDWIEQGALGEPIEDPIPRAFVFKDSLETLR
jgi:hypothetical protein